MNEQESGLQVTTRRFANLFRGNASAYGAYQEIAGGDSRVRTIRAATPPTVWASHLQGEGPYLGQIPICAGDICHFGAIDLDDEQSDHEKIAQQVSRANFPLVVCRSKSGGAHLYLFLQEPTDAALVQDALRDISSTLEARNPNDRPIEIFPKQRSVAKGTVGNWINLPYYGGDTTNRYAVDSRGRKLTLAEFLELAERSRVGVDELKRCLNPFRADGPPCLATLHCMGLGKGSRNEGLFNVGVNFKLSNPAGWETQLRDYNSNWLEGPLPEHEVTALVASLRKKDYAYKCDQSPIKAHCEKKKCVGQRFGIRASQNAGGPAPGNQYTDVANAERFVAAHGEEVRFCKGLNSWLHFDGQRWNRDEKGRIEYVAQEHAKSVAAALVSELDTAPGADPRDAIKRVMAAQQLQQRPRLLNMIGLARVRQPIATSVSELDCDPMLLNCSNGTLDLRTSTLREHRRCDLLTRLAPVVYDENAACPRWSSFIEEITSGDKSFAAFLQRAVGISLTGIATDQKIFLCVGNGANGKTVFLETLRELLGDYGTTASSNTFLHNQNGGVGGAPRSDIVKLAGMRFVSASEVTEGRRFDEQLIKTVTGGEKVAARAVYAAQEIEFTPQFKLWIAMNHTPDVFGEDDGIWRRLMVLPFDFKVEDGKKDPDLLRRLGEERPGILAWAIRGLGMWQEQGGVGTCERIREASGGYRDDQDILRDFIEECIEDDPGGAVTSAGLMQAYSAWCQDRQLAPLGQKAVTRKLRGRGWTQAKTVRGRPWRGKRIRPGKERF